MKARGALVGPFGSLMLLLAAAIAGCTDALPQAPQEAALAAPDAGADDCGWVRWTERSGSAAEWFAAHPDVSVLHHWTAEVGAFRSYTSRSAESARLARGAPLWLEKRGAEAIVQTVSFADAGKLVTLRPGMNLIAWTGGADSAPTLREALRWISRDLVSLTRWDAAAQRCRQEIKLPHTLELSAALGAGDLLALELRSEAVWFQSHAQRPIFQTAGDVSVEAYRELRDEAANAAGYIAAAYGQATNSFAAVLQEHVGSASRAYELWTGFELDTSWWPVGACGVAWHQVMILLAGCGEPIAFDHEYVHVLQHELAIGRRGSAWDIHPNWLIEGMASYIAARYRGAADHQPYREARAEAVRGAESAPPLVDLESTAQWRSAEPVPAYAAGLLAAEWLAAYAGEDSLFEYARQLQRAGLRWYFAFETAFGLSAGEFYKAFEQHAPVFAEPLPHRIRGRLIDPSGLPVDGMRISAHPQHGGIRRSGAADAEGRFEIAAASGEYILSVESESGCTEFGFYRMGQIVHGSLQAEPIRVGMDRSADVVVRLPAARSELRGWSTCAPPEDGGWLRGAVLDPQGRGVPDVEVSVCGRAQMMGCRSVRTDAQGAYTLDAPPGQFEIYVGPASGGCRLWGARGVQGELAAFADAVSAALGTERLRGVDIRLPAPPDEWRRWIGAGDSVSRPTESAPGVA